MKNQHAEDVKDKKVANVYAAMFGEQDPTPEQIAAAKMARKIEKQGLDAFTLQEILAHVNMTLTDYNKVQKSKKRGSRGAYFTAKDEDFIKFLALAKYSTDSIIGYAQGEKGIKDFSAQRHLKRLIDKGLVKRTHGDRVKTLYALTPEGMRQSGYNLDTMGDSVNEQSVQPTLGASWALAEYWKDGYRDFVSEQMIKSSLGKLNNQSEGAYKVIATKALLLWRNWKDTDPDNSPEKTNPFLYAIPQYDLDKKVIYHIPDLVVVNPRVKADEKGKPVIVDGAPIIASKGERSVPWSIAVEVERTHHSVEKYTKIMKCYRMDRNVFSKVIWYAATDAIGKKIYEGCKAAHMPEDRYSILPFTRKNDKGEDVRFRGADFKKM